MRPRRDQRELLESMSLHTLECAFCGIQGTPVKNGREIKQDTRIYTWTTEILTTFGQDVDWSSSEEEDQEASHYNLDEWDET